VKLKGGIYWAATEVNVFSLEIIDIVEVDVLILTEDETIGNEKAS
jgi:hypothetical protein